MLMNFGLLMLALLQVPQVSFEDMTLNGKWDFGMRREYTMSADVPGFPLATNEFAPDTVWYRRSVCLPEGDWTDAVLEMKGARFRPSVFVDGVLAGSFEGGMSRIFCNLDNLPKGKTVTLEIALASLKDVPLEDASYIPGVDQWRSNVSSSLWDDVVLHLYRGARADRLLVFPGTGSGKAELRYRVRGNGASYATLTVSKAGKPVLELNGTAAEGENSVRLDYAGKLEEWSPEHPSCYESSLKLFDADGKEISEYEQTLALRRMQTRKKQFVLNGRNIRLRGGSVVWHRWVRDPEGRELAYDTAWFAKNIIRPIKEHGGNYLRFHLGVPPEVILDMCDRYGLVVQYEWNFFHGMPASRKSLDEQYAAWFDVASRHPSPLLFHPYNETEEDQLKTVWASLDSLSGTYPPMLLAARDVFHLHRYWWGMSENLGLYYDSYKQFRLPIMVDEFGGIYLDGEGNYGGYPMLPGAMLRLLGPDNTAEDRLYQQDMAYGKVGEYWRRIGAAGVASFPLLCSWDDGNHWFEGKLKDGRPKHVWDMMTAVWSDRTVSMDVWNRNYAPSSRIKVPLHFINDSCESAGMDAVFRLRDSAGKLISEKPMTASVAAGDRKILYVMLELPSERGDYSIETELLNPSAEVKYPVVSSWDIRVLAPVVSDKVKAARIFVPRKEKELRRMAVSTGLRLVDMEKDADIVLVGENTWASLDSWRSRLDGAISSGKAVVMLDAGERNLGKAYIRKGRNLENLARPILDEAETSVTPVLGGLSVSFVEQCEGESHIHPKDTGRVLWKNLPPDAGRLWNGLRGGLIVPALSLDVNGLSQESFVSLWTSRGADADKIRSGSYYAYEYCGFYAFSDRGDDEDADKYLKDKVHFLVEDMPSLELLLPTSVPTKITDLHSAYVGSEHIRVSDFKPLVIAGKGLVRTPVVEISFGEGEGRLIISQLLTSGRLAPRRHILRGDGHPAEFDVTAVQMVLNMLEEVL